IVQESTLHTDKIVSTAEKSISQYAFTLRLYYVGRSLRSCWGVGAIVQGARRGQNRGIVLYRFSG
ncbi:hypothetical protein, partial [Salmonella sp. s54395]|uniref:hypothetical protein n=1 Tax=Salmonella sp. s54395 TaxID=3159664 RepID=UPI00397EB6BD